MSRYSPTVLPQPAAPITSYFSEGLDSYLQERKRQRDELADKAKLATEGVRSGTAPSESIEPPTTPASPSVRQPDPFAVRAPSLRSQAPTRSDDPFATSTPFSLTRSPATPSVPSSDAFDPAGAARALTQQARVTSMPAVADPTASPTPTQPVGAAATVPGAFDPMTGMFGSPATRGPRYVQLDKGHYLDTFAARGGEQQAIDRMMVADMLRGRDIAQRGDQQAAHDDRTDARQDKALAARPVPIQRQVASRVKELTDQGVDLDKANEQAREELGYQQPAPKAPAGTTQQQMRARISELVASGKSLADANKQARSEFGYAPPSTAQSTRGLTSLLTSESGSGSVAEMETVKPKMEATEALIDSGQVPMTGWDSFSEGLITHARQNAGFIDAAVAQQLLGQLGRTNPKLLTYATNQLAWIMGDLNVSRGSSDERQRLATIVDGINLPVGSMDPDERHQYITDMQARRNARLEKLKRGAAATDVIVGRVIDSAKPDGSSAAPHAGASAWKAANPKKAGETDQQYYQRYLKAAGGQP